MNLLRRLFRRPDPRLEKLNKQILWHQLRITDLTDGNTAGLTDAQARKMLAHHARELHLLETYRKVAYP